MALDTHEVLKDKRDKTFPMLFEIAINILFLQKNSMLQNHKKSLNLEVDLESNFGSASYLFCEFRQVDEMFCLHTFPIILYDC